PRKPACLARSTRTSWSLPCAIAISSRWPFACATRASCRSRPWSSTWPARSDPSCSRLCVGRAAPDLSRGNVHVQGDPRAVSRARRLARILGMTPRTIAGLDPIAYHAAAGLVANGAAAIAAVGAELLMKAGVAPAVAPKMLGPLLRSVAENVERLGLPEALTGSVRRGDVAGLEKHLATLRAKLPQAVSLYLAAAEAQLPLARAIGDAPGETFDAIARSLARARGGTRRGPFLRPSVPLGRK